MKVVNEMESRKISFNELMQECHIDDPVEFRRLLKRNKLPVINSKKLIEKKIADQIAERLVGNKIDWYKYETQQRDQIQPGPLVQKENTIEISQIENWFQEIIKGRRGNSFDQDQILGCISIGGFLEGTNSTEFKLCLDPHVNILIGDRGSGKSTVLNLIGLLADSITEETNVLVTKLMNLLSQNFIEIATINRRVRKFLHDYGISKYICFYIKNQKIYCYMVCMDLMSFNLLKYEEQNWTSVHVGDSLIGPGMQILQQGEVIKIAEDKNRFYIHNILDNLHPNLYKKRTAFAHEIKQFINQSRYFKPVKLTCKSELIETFIYQRNQELKSIIFEINKNSVNDNVVNIIKSYINRFYSINRRQLPQTIFELIESDDQDAFYFLYLNRIIGYLNDEMANIDLLRKQQSDLLNELGIIKETEDIGEINEGGESSDLLEEMTSDKNLLEQIEKPLVAIENEPQEELNYFLKTLEIETGGPIGKKILLKTRRIVEFLQTRLGVLRSWLKIFTKTYVELDESLLALIHGYKRLLKTRINLIEAQVRKCNEITEQLNKDDLEINVFTINSEQTIIEHQNAIDSLGKIELFYNRLFKSDSKVELRFLFDTSSIYLSRVNEFFERLNRIINEFQNEFLFIPIDIQLRQGHKYRDFRQLSFGQKSGIILKMVLSNSNKKIILIDQPEDHLDAYSVVNMLTSTLNRLGTDRQIIIATHNSNLVMGMNNNNLIILESLGENGRVKAQGPSIHKKNVVREMVEILEGGIDTFNQKMIVYEQFINRVRGSIEDMDVVMIESFFRRRSIDKLRNFFQPVVSDRSFLDYIRHELRNRTINSPIQNDIALVQKELSTLNLNKETELDLLFQKLQQLCKNLDTHLFRLQSEIEQIRLMDTQPKFEIVNLYELLQELSQDILTKLEKKRKIKIKIDSEIQNILISADQGHLRLVFRNLFHNAARATELKAWNLRKKGYFEFYEFIKVDYSLTFNQRLFINFCDNGCGIPFELIEKLYIERCTNQKGRDHGLGGVIIRKLLDLNGGSIRIVKSDQETDIVTIQEISLPIFTI